MKKTFLFIFILVMIICACIRLMMSKEQQESSNITTTIQEQMETTPIVTSINTTTTPKPTYSEPEYHDELMNGDFSAISGDYVNSEGKVIKLNDKGLKDEKEIIHGDVYYVESLGIYQRPLWWGDLTEGGYTITVYPVGVETFGLNTDTSLIRISYGHAEPIYEEEIYYLYSNPIPKFHNELMEGNLSAIKGVYINPKGDILTLNENGGVRNSKLRDKLKYRDGYYYMQQDTPDGYGFYCNIYMIGTEVKGFQEIINSDTSKIRIFCGNATPMSTDDIYTFNK